MKVKSESEDAQLCPTLSYPMDYSLPGSSIHGIFQARGLEWGAIAFFIPHHMEKEMLTYSSILAWKIPWSEEPDRLQSLGSQRVDYDLATEHALTHSITSAQTYLYIQCRAEFKSKWIPTVIRKCCKDSETGMLLRCPLSIPDNEWTETQSKAKPSSMPMFCTDPHTKLSSSPHPRKGSKNSQ